MNLENIPAHLKANAKWCVFKYEKRNGNMSKVPYNPVTGKKADVKKPETFTDFDTAVSVLKDYDGLGIRVDGTLIAIDLDHCIEDGKLTGIKEAWMKNLTESASTLFVTVQLPQVEHTCPKCKSSTQRIKDYYMRHIHHTTVGLKNLKIQYR